MGKSFKDLAVGLMVVAAILGGLIGCDSSETGSPQSGSSLSEKPAGQPVSTVAPADKERAIKQASDATDAWLKLIDAGNYKDAWTQTGASFKQSTTQDGWSKQTAAIRLSMGPLISRTVKAQEFLPDLTGEPPGSYVRVRYDASFKNAEKATEEVTAVYDSGTWRPLGYYLTVKRSQQ